MATWPATILLQLGYRQENRGMIHDSQASSEFETAEKADFIAVSQLEIDKQPGPLTLKGFRYASAF